MLERPALKPALGAADSPGQEVTQEQVSAHLHQWRADTAATRESLNGWRQQVEASSKMLENPNAAFEYIDFFAAMFDRVLVDLDRVTSELPTGFKTEHADVLRQIASNGAVEQRRPLIFRDKWVNKPLPYEQVRPLLTQLAGEIRDQLQDYKEMTLAATRLAQLAPPPPVPPAPPKPEESGFDRRALFTRLIRPLGDEGEKP